MSVLRKNFSLPRKSWRRLVIYPMPEGQLSLNREIWCSVIMGIKSDQSIFIEKYNQLFNVPNDKASKTTCERYKSEHPNEFKRSNWSIKKHRKKFMDWMSSRLYKSPKWYCLSGRRGEKYLIYVLVAVLLGVGLPAYFASAGFSSEDWGYNLMTRLEASDDDAAWSTI